MGKYLEIDFFDTVCGLFTVIGLGIAIFQIAKLRSEKEIVLAVRGDYFKKENIGRIEEAVKLTIELRDQVAGAEYSRASLVAIIAKIDRIFDLLQKIENHQIMIGCEVIVDCGNCLTLLVGVKEELRRIIDAKEYRQFRQNHYSGMVDQIKREVEKCEIELKK